MSNIKDVCCKPGLYDLVHCISWSMAAMLCDIIFVIEGHMRPQSMPLAILTMKKELHGFLFLCMHVVLFL